MPTPLNLWSGNLPSDVLLEGGVLLIGSTVFSAQDGGLKFDPGAVQRAIPFDGMRSEVAGTHRNVGWKAVISGTILEVQSTAFTTGIVNLMPGAANATVSGGPANATQVQPKTAGVLYASGDYTPNLRAVWERGDGTIWQVRFPKAMCTKWDIAGKDKEEGKFAVSFAAILDMSANGNTLSTPPFVIEYAAALS